MWIADRAVEALDTAAFLSTTPARPYWPVAVVE